MDYFTQLQESYKKLKKRKFKLTISESTDMQMPSINPEVQIKLDNLAGGVFGYKFIEIDGLLKEKSIDELIQKTKKYKCLNEHPNAFTNNSWNLFIEKLTQQLINTKVLIHKHDGTLITRNFYIEEQLDIIDLIQKLGSVCWKFIKTEMWEKPGDNEIGFIRDSVKPNTIRNYILLGDKVPIDDYKTGISLDSYSFVNKLNSTLDWLGIILFRLNNAIIDKYKYNRNGNWGIFKSGKNLERSLASQYDNHKLLKSQVGEEAINLAYMTSLMSREDVPYEDKVNLLSTSISQTELITKVEEIRLSLELANQGFVFVNENLMQQVELKEAFESLGGSIEDPASIQNIIDSSLGKGFALINKNINPISSSFIKTRTEPHIKRNTYFYFDQDPTLNFSTILTGINNKIGRESFPPEVLVDEGKFKVGSLVKFNILEQEQEINLGFGYYGLNDIVGNYDDRLSLELESKEFVTPSQVFALVFKKINGIPLQLNHKKKLEKIAKSLDFYNIFLNTRASNKDLLKGIRQLKTSSEKSNYEVIRDYTRRFSEVEQELEKTLPSTSIKRFIRRFNDKLLLQELQKLSDSGKSEDRQLLAAIFAYYFCDLSEILIVNISLPTNKVYITTQDSLLKEITIGISKGTFTTTLDLDRFIILCPKNNRIGSIEFFKGILGCYISSAWFINRSLEINMADNLNMLSFIAPDLANQFVEDQTKKMQSSLVSMSFSK